ncbi:MAG: TonB-dependent receptor [Bacteroidia bacterium]
MKHRTTTCCLQTFAINKTFNKAVSLYAAYTTGYKAPSELQCPDFLHRRSEQLAQAGTRTPARSGHQGQHPEQQAVLHWLSFNATFSDKFTAKTVQDASNTVTLYSYLVNGGNLNNNGLELSARYNLVESKTAFMKLLRPFFNVTWSDFTYQDYRYEVAGSNGTKVVYDYSGNAVAGVAPLVLNAGIDADTRVGIYGNITYNHRSSMYYTSDGLNEAAPYNLVNAKLGFRKSIKDLSVDVFAGANNITGIQYYNMVFVNQLPDAYIPAPREINFFSGLNVAYRF